MTEKRSKTVRLVEIAGILGVTHQRASRVVGERGFPKPGRQPGPEPFVGPARRHGVGEGLAA